MIPTERLARMIADAGLGDFRTMHDVREAIFERAKKLIAEDRGERANQHQSNFYGTDHADN
jgi:hypothetical protein